MAAILQLGNMFFEASDVSKNILIFSMVVTYIFDVTLQKNGQEAAVIKSPPETLQSIGNLLGGPPEKYELSITNKITVC